MCDEMRKAVRERAESLLATGKKDEVLIYLAENPLEQQILFWLKHKDWLDAYLEEGYAFYVSNVLLFVKMATLQQVQTYLKHRHFLTSEAEIEFIYRFGVEGVKSFYEARHEFSESAKILIVNQFTVQDLLQIMPFLAKKGLSDIGQKQLFGRKRLDLLKAYIENGGCFISQYQCQLINLGVQDLIDAYFVSQPMSLEAAKLLGAK